MHAEEEITALLNRAAAGDRAAEEVLIPRVYAELKQLAAFYLRGERDGHTLQTTALVHEAYVRLAAQREGRWENRTHFFGIAARLMRNILTDYARQRLAAKRGGGVQPIQIDEAVLVPDVQCSEISDLDDALTRLAVIDPRQAKIVELRFFGGLTEDEIALLLNLSVKTIKRDWAAARAWLYGELRNDV